MKAIMLAAGVGRRLYGDDYEQPPKALLPFGGRTLLDRHVENLQALGVDQLVMVLGHRADEIIAAAHAAAGRGYIHPIHNPQYRGGPIISLWCARDVMRSGDDVLFMDADVLYHPTMLERLIRSEHDNCFLFDGDIEDGDDPVRVCLKDGLMVDFGKKITGDFDRVGEWPGFMKMSPRIASRVADACQDFIDTARMHATYEEAMREVLMDEPPGTFGIEDISGIPWIEIDFPADLIRAEKHILPRIARPLAADAIGDDMADATSKSAS